MAKEQNVCLVCTQENNLLPHIKHALGRKKITLKVCKVVDPDQLVSENTSRCMKSSSKTLLLLTKSDIDKWNKWKHRIKSLEGIQLRLIFAEKCVAENFREASMCSIPGHVIDTNRKNWDEHLIIFANTEHHKQLLHIMNLHELQADQLSTQKTLIENQAETSLMLQNEVKQSLNDRISDFEDVIARLQQTERGKSENPLSKHAGTGDNLHPVKNSIDDLVQTKTSKTSKIVQRKLTRSLSAMPKVFIFHSEDDIEKADEICRYLKRNRIEAVTRREYECNQDNNHRIQIIEEAVKTHDRIVLLLTNKSAKSSWISLHVIFALEQSLIRRHMLLRVILCDVEAKDCPVLQTGFLSHIPQTDGDFWVSGKQTDHTDFLRKITEERPLCTLLSVGNLPRGLVFSHIFGYQKYLSKDLRSILLNDPLDTYGKNKRKFPLKFYQLLPDNCHIRNTLETTHDEARKAGIRISVASDKVEFKNKHVGKQRTYVLTVYKIEDLSSKEEYYFCGGYPPSINAIYELGRLELVDVDFQFERLKHEFNTVVHHRQSELGGGCYKLLPFDVSNSEVEYARVLLSAIRNDLSTTQGKSSDTPTHTEDEKSDVCVHFLDNTRDGAEDNDNKIADQIVTFLNSHRIPVETIHDIQRGGQSELHFPRRSWHIVVLSKRMMESETVDMYKLICLLTQSVRKNNIRVIPILNDADIDEVPLCIAWVTYLTTKTEDYQRHLLHILRGQPMELHSQIPAGNVTKSLAWAYVFNYLETALLRKTKKTGRDLKERIKAFLQEKNIDCKCLLKLVVVWPKRCLSKPELHTEINKSYSKQNCKLEYLGKLEPMICSTGGQVDRHFYLHVVKYTDTDSGKSFCFLEEYCSAFGCLYDMSMDKSSSFSGMNEKEMYRQGKEFKEEFEEIISRKEVKEKVGDFTDLVKVIYYDDETESLKEVLQSKEGLDVDFDRIDNLPRDKWVSR